MPKPVVAIVGRPNVGKSTLFNKIAGSRISIVEDTPGITRDRIYADADWCGVNFSIVDTGGIEPAKGDVVMAEMLAQAELAIETADVIIFITDIRDGLTASDTEVAAMLKKSGKPVVLACNKADTPGEPPAELYEFYNLGIGDPMPISSIHGMGVGDLLDKILELMPKSEGEEEEADAIKVAVIGKPNAGKSSLVNRVLGENRVIVSDRPGTTRDAIDSFLEKDGKSYVFIDTAGIRRKSRVSDNIERYSVIRALAAIDRCDVAVLVIDGSEGVSEQDAKIAGFAHEAGKGIVIAVNKWDAVEKDDKTMNRYKNDIFSILSFITYAPMLFISAKTGQRVQKLFELIEFVNEKNHMRVSTGTLNDVVNDAVIRSEPPSDKGRRLKIFYATQASTAPPTFVFFVNDRELAHFSYLRYLENRIREAFELTGTPVRIIIRERSREQ